jgi:hypothetical protein
MIFRKVRVTKRSQLPGLPTVQAATEKHIDTQIITSKGSHKTRKGTNLALRDHLGRGYKYKCTYIDGNYDGE